MKHYLLSLLLLVSTSIAFADTTTQLAHVNIPGYTHQELLARAKAISTPEMKQATTQGYTVIPYYNAVLKQAQTDVKKLIQINKVANKEGDINQLVKNVGQYFIKKGTPYGDVGAMGEGDWCNGNLTKRGCMHIAQDPIYRTDILDCVTLINIAMGLVNSPNLASFNKNVVAVAYGAAEHHGYSPKDIAYLNRDNIVSANFNPVNEEKGLLKNVTAVEKEGGKFLTKKTSASISIKTWFDYLARHDYIAGNVRVLKKKNGEAMANLLSKHYASMFPDEKVSINYIPKSVLVKEVLSPEGYVYEPNEKNINQIVTPSVVEIVRDSSQWNIDDKNIKDVIGTGLNVSHVALLYRDNFKKDQVIYQRITCHYDDKQQKVCVVRPITCNKDAGCSKVMMLAATNAYPDGYYWSENKKTGKYYCTSGKDIPPGSTKLTQCNRVTAMPLGDYLARYEYGRYLYMESSSIVGIHVEKILDPRKKV